MIEEGQHLWTPSEDFVKQSNLTRYLKWLREHRDLDFNDYEYLRQWSVQSIEDFWQSLWDYFEIISDTPCESIVDRHVMPGARWFEGSRVNFAEHMLRHEQRAAEDDILFHHLTESRDLDTMSWQETGSWVRILATQLRQMGVQPGDRVVAYMPNTPEAAIAMLATIAIGAVWSSAAPEFGSNTVIDRFSQIEPKIIFCASGYRFAGKDFSRVDELKKIIQALPTLETIIWMNYPDEDCRQLPAIDNVLSLNDLMNHPPVPAAEFEYERVPFDHPLWVVFSSGTTGIPKAIVHSHVGVLLEMSKTTHFHINLKPDSTMFFYSTTGWIMWNILLSAMLQGASVVLYDGNPAYPNPDRLWELAAHTGATNFGASPMFVQMMEKAGLEPGKQYDLSALEGILVSGAPSTPETFAWFYRSVKQDLWVTSQSGGTEIASAFVGAIPTLPVYAGEIQTRALGMDVHAFDEDGNEIYDEVGELVVTSPFPSMPICFWNDRDGRRYHESYFDVYEGVWRHGDFIKINDRGGCYIYGRSDSTLNRHGVRIGTAEIYRCVEQIDGILDSLVVCANIARGGHYMPLFVTLDEDITLDENLKERIKSALRAECSPRHVPDEIVAVDAIPYTLTGKKMEIPVRKLITGTPLEQAASPDAMQNPESIDFFVRFAEHSKDKMA